MVIKSNKKNKFQKKNLLNSKLLGCRSRFLSTDRRRPNVELCKGLDVVIGRCSVILELLV